MKGQKFQLEKIGMIVILAMIGQWYLFPSNLTAVGTHQMKFQQQTNKFFYYLDRVAENKTAQQSIETSTDDHQSLLNAFLDDLINTMALFEQQDVLSPDLSPAQNFVERWKDVGGDCESCTESFAVIQRILDHLSLQMTSRANGTSPLSGLYGFYQDMAQQDLGGFESLFQFVWPDPQMRRTWVYEKKLIRGFGKEEGTYIQERHVRKEVNDQVVFEEWIRDDHLTSFGCAPQEISFLHQALREMKQDSADPDAINLVQSLVDLLDQEIQVAWHTGDLADFSYQFLHNPDFQARQLAISKHPIMKPPYSPHQFEILKYYRNIR